MFFCIVCVNPLCASVYLCLVVTCWERADLLVPFVVYNCEFVTFPLVSRVRCGNSFTPLLTKYPWLAKMRLVVVFPCHTLFLFKKHFLCDNVQQQRRNC